MFKGDDRIKRRKCRATGKVSFSSKGEAHTIMLWLKWRFKHPPKRPDGTRVKRGQLKAAPRRIYYCTYCNGYHMTRSVKQFKDASSANGD